MGKKREYRRKSTIEKVGRTSGGNARDNRVRDRHYGLSVQTKLADAERDEEPAMESAEQPITPGFAQWLVNRCLAKRAPKPSLSLRLWYAISNSFTAINEQLDWLCSFRKNKCV